MSKPSLEKPAHEYHSGSQDTSLFGIGVLQTPRISHSTGGRTPCWGGCCCTGCGSSQAKSVPK